MRPHLRALLVSLLPACGGDVGIVVAGGGDDDASDSGLPTDPDQDGDGVRASQDCDDFDADTYPGAPEVAEDGIDQNCNGADALLEYGFRQDEGATTLVEGFLFGNRVTLDDALTVEQMGVLVRNANAATIRMGVYRSDGGRPTELMAETAPTAAVDGVQQVPLVQPVTLEEGDWWVQIIAEQAVEIGAGDDTLLMYREWPASDPLPDPYGTATDYEGPRASLFVSGSLPE